MKWTNVECHRWLQFVTSWNGENLIKRNIVLQLVINGYFAVRESSVASKHKFSELVNQLLPLEIGLVHHLGSAMTKAWYNQSGGGQFRRWYPKSAFTFFEPRFESRVNGSN